MASGSSMDGAGGGGGSNGGAGAGGGRDDNDDSDENWGLWKGQCKQLKSQYKKKNRNNKTHWEA